MLLFWKLVDETQISKPQDYTNTFRQILTSIFLSVRAILKETVQCETPCKYNFAHWTDQIWSITFSLPITKVNCQKIGHVLDIKVVLQYQRP